MRSPEERARDEQRVEQALLGQLLPRHDERLHTKVVGVTKLNPDGSSRQAAIEEMHQFDVVELVRNPGDEWDSNAIQVVVSLERAARRKKGEPAPAAGSGAAALSVTSRRVQIGFLDAALAAELAPKIDHGERWWAIATRVGGPRTQGVSLMLCRLAPAAGSAAPPRVTRP
jgi:hypothetical protein